MRTVVTCSLPAEGTRRGRVARRSRPTPCRQSSTTHFSAGSADRALQGTGRDVAPFAQDPGQARRSAASFARRYSYCIAVGSKVAARGRAASPTKRGRSYEEEKGVVGLL